MLRACLHHGFMELTQIDTFYNGLNENDQDSLNATAGGNLLSKSTREALHIIENKSKVRYSRNKPNVSRMNTTFNENASNTDDRIDKLAEQISTLVDIFVKKVVTPAMVKAVEESCVTCGGTLLSNTISNPKGKMKAITTHSGVAYEGPSIPTKPSPKKVVERETEETTNKEQTNFQRSTTHIQPPVVPIPEPDVPKTLPKPNIPYPSRLNDQKLREKATNQMEKFFQIFQDLHFDISFADALLLIPKFASTIKIVDFEADPRVPLILGRSFLRTVHALIDIYGEEITLQVNDEAVTFNLNHTTRYSSTYVDLSVNQIDIIDVAREEYILVAVDYLSKWVEAKALPTNDAHVVVKFLKSLFARFGTPRAIISDRGTHFCNDKFTKVMSKYGVAHRLSTAYHPQTSGQVDVSNRGLKRILERTVRENRASWSEKLDDTLWAFRTAYKTPIGCTPYTLVYGKSCHLPIELEHKAYWVSKHVNLDLKTMGDHQKLQLNELNELRDQAYENSLIYKEKTKKIHDFKIKNRIFNVGDRVLVFNSYLKIFSGKLKTRWSGPFTIIKVFPYGTVDLSQPDGPNFKVNGHRVKHYFRGP
nr:reverse transcriptase domain-containing protein [Tanacetum cinerariifolium]